MAAKQLVFSEDARRKLRNGMNTVANAVGATLGPKGRNVAVDRKFGSPTITHDGVSVAKEIELEDPFENMGALLRLARNSLRKLPRRPTTLLVMVQPPRRFWHTQLLMRALKLSKLATIRCCSSTAFNRQPSLSLKNCVRCPSR